MPAHLHTPPLQRTAPGGTGLLQAGALLQAPLPESDGRFIHLIDRQLPAAADGLPYVRARFQLGRFTPELFASYGIEFPLHIRNSVTKRQAEFAAGRICAQSVLASYGHGQSGIAIGASREPLWPEGFIGSITHNGQYAAAIACPRGDLLGVGIDIESIVDDAARPAMSELVVTEQETACLRGCGGELDFDRLLTLVFSAKESFFKAAFPHVQQFIDFDAIRVVQVDVQRRLLQFESVYDVSEHLRAGRRYSACFEFVDSGSVFTVVLLRSGAVTDNSDSSPIGQLGV